MSLHLVTPPAAPVLTLAEARAHLRVDAWGSPESHPDDAIIQHCVNAASLEVDGWNGWLGRALVTQEWRLVLDEFPGRNMGRIWLPLPPLQSVTSITYLDAEGATQTLDSAAYRVVTDTEIGFVEPVMSGAWPGTAGMKAAVRINYRCGYGNEGTDVPELIRAYIRIRLGQMYEHREAVIAGAPIAEVPWYRNSLENYRIRGALKGAGV